MIKGIIFDWIGTLYERDKGVFSYSDKVLKELKPRYKLGLVTLSKSADVRRKKEVESSGIMHYFDCIIIDSSKDKEQYLKCMDELKITPETTAIVDDRTLRGIKTGNQLGCITYWIKNGDYANEIPNEETGLPTYIINSLEDLLKAEIGLCEPDLSSLPSSTKLVYKILQSEGDFLNSKEIAKAAGIPPRTVRYAIRILLEKNLLLRKISIKDLRNESYSVGKRL